MTDQQSHGVTNAPHTPGPWRASQTFPLGDYCIHAAGIPQQLAYLRESTVVNWPLEANARLIAAAPDLLAALNVVVAMAEDFLTDPTQDHDHLLTALDGCRAAIAKAQQP